MMVELIVGLILIAWISHFDAFVDTLWCKKEVSWLKKHLNEWAYFYVATGFVGWVMFSEWWHWVLGAIAGLVATYIGYRRGGKSEWFDLLFFWKLFKTWRDRRTLN